MFDAEKLAKLSPEQLVIVNKEIDERSKRLSCLDRMDAAKAINDMAGYDQAYKDYKSLIKDRCDHDRSIWSNCAACYEIQKILSPEESDDD